MIIKGIFLYKLNVKSMKVKVVAKVDLESSVSNNYLYIIDAVVVFLLLF